MEHKFTHIDVHTHVNLSAYDEDRDAVEEHTLAEGVAHINVGTQKDTSKKAVELAEKYEGAYASIGVHPVHTSRSFHDPLEFGEEGKAFTSRGEVFDMEYYRTLAQHPKVVAIGECGLDYFRLSENRGNVRAESDDISTSERMKEVSEAQYRVEKDTKHVQEEAFKAQIALANELGKPLMLHIRPSEGSMDAYEDALVILKEHAKVLGNVHFFAGTYEVAKKFWEIGFTTSLTGVITFTTQYDEVVRNAPLDMLHAETDAPYVTPKPFRGQRNEPLHVREVYKRIAELRGEDEEKVRLQLLENARRVFGVRF